MIFPNKIIKLIDFGLSKKMKIDYKKNSDLTNDKITEITLIGISPSWAAPEVI